MHFELDWYDENGGRSDYATINLTKLQWTGNIDGSLLLERKYINWVRDESEKDDFIEKIIFYPAREGYQSSINS